jgi:hypothetical protein
VNYFLVSLYVGALVAANLTVAHFGPIVSPIIGFLFIGLDLSLRDSLHDRWVGNGLAWKMLGMFAVAGGLSYVLNPASAQIAIASVVAFLCAAVVDTFAYGWLRSKGFLVRANGSNAAGALVDSIVFPTLAFGVVMPEIMALQFLAKTSGGFLWSLALQKMVKA